MDPKNSTRIDFKIKKTASLENCCGPESVIFPRFMLSCPFKIWFWKFICNIFQILTKFWRWFHSKRMNHFVLINFSNSVFSYANCSAQICTLFLKYLSFFFYWLFWADSFFVFSVTPQSCIIQIIKNFLCGKIFFLNKTASIEWCKTGDSVKTGKKQQETKRQTQWIWWKGICVDLNTNMNSS